MRLSPLEEPLTVQTPEPRRSRPHGFVKVACWAPDKVSAQHQRPHADRLGMVGAQRLAQIGMSKAAVGIFKKDAKSRKRTENSLERRRVCLRRFRELISCSRL